MRKISVVIANRHQTSISLEEEFYEALEQLAAEKGVSLNTLITQIDRERKDKNLSAAVRVYILKILQQKLTGKEDDV